MAAVYGGEVKKKKKQNGTSEKKNKKTEKKDTRTCGTVSHDYNTRARVHTHARTHGPVTGASYGV